MTSPLMTRKRQTLYGLLRAQFEYIRSTPNLLRRGLLFVGYGTPLFALLSSFTIILFWLLGFRFSLPWTHSFVLMMAHHFAFIYDSSLASRWPYLNAVVYSYDIALNLVAAACLLIENIIFSIALDFKSTRQELVTRARLGISRVGYFKILLVTFLLFSFALYVLLLELFGRGLLTSDSSYATQAAGFGGMAFILDPARTNMLILPLAAFIISIFPILYVTMTWRLGLIFYYALIKAE